MKHTPEIEKLIEEVKIAVEESRAIYGFGTDDPSDIQPPTWLAELEAAVEAVENAQENEEQETHGFGGTTMVLT